MEFEKFVANNLKFMKKQKWKGWIPTAAAVEPLSLSRSPVSTAAIGEILDDDDDDDDELGPIKYSNSTAFAGKSDIDMDIEMMCCCQSLSESIPADFCNNTSLHGLKYISERKRHFFERLFWAVMFVTGICAAVYLISNVWEKYSQNPVIISFDVNETSIEDIPFPAVTICNNNKLPKSKVQHFVDRLEKNMNDSEALEAFYYLTEVCLSSKTFTNRFGYSVFETNDTLVKKAAAEFRRPSNQQAEIHDFLKKHAQECTDMIPQCTFQDIDINCTDIFNPIITSFGKCCTFNMVPNILREARNTFSVSPEEAKGWEEADLSYSGLIMDGKRPAGRYPFRQTRAGRSFGLSFMLAPHLHESSCKNSDSYGFKLSLHLSAEVPDLINSGYSIPHNSEIFMSVTPEITKAHPSITAYPLEKRQCYLQNEKNLKYYRNYTVSSCHQECVTDKVYRRCKCVRFYMPRNDTLPLCGPEKFNCTEAYKANISKKGLKYVCPQCFPLCTEINFSAQISSSQLQPGIWRMPYSNQEAPWANDSVSIVHIYFQEDSFYARIRTELFGFTDLLANTGGLLGLCLGFSALSGVELIYFLTLRQFCQRGENQHQQEQRQSEQKKKPTKPKVVPLWKCSKNSKNPLQKNKVDGKAKALGLTNKLITSTTTTSDFNSCDDDDSKLNNFPPSLSIRGLMASHGNGGRVRDIIVGRHGQFQAQYWNPAAAALE